MNPLEAIITRQLEVVAGLHPSRGDRAYSSHAELLLARGRCWTASPLPSFVGRGRMKLCYQNTLELIRQVNAVGTEQGLPALRYVEGYAIPVINGEVLIPVPHAWAVTPNGTVWDRTWPEPENSAYFGMTFDWDDVERFDRADVDYVGILESDYLLGFPLLETGHLFPPDQPERDELIPGSRDWERNFHAEGYHEGVTCDWGDCNRPAVTLRNDRRKYGWLPVCEGCRLWPGRMA